MKTSRIIIFLAAAALLLAGVAVSGCSPSEDEPEPPPAVLKVACVGDSITEGLMIPDPERDSYPAQLQALLGEGYDVGNFGVSGRTLQNNVQSDYASPYTGESAYTDSLEFLPDIVLIMLGTNDAFWSWDAAAYEADLEAFIDIYKNLDSSPDVYLMTCAPYILPLEVSFDAGWVIPAEVNPIINSVAERTGARVIDIYAALDDRRDLFADGLHPNAEGAAVIAQTVYDALTAVHDALI